MLDNEITAAFQLAFTAVMQRRSPSIAAARTKERPNAASSGLSASEKKGIVSTWQTSESGMTPNPTLGSREKGLCHNYTSLSFSPSSIDITGAENGGHVQTLGDKKKKESLCLGGRSEGGPSPPLIEE